MKLEVCHNHGFFSNCSVAIEQLSRFVENHNKLPDELCMARSFDLYKFDPDKDVTSVFFNKDISTDRLGTPPKTYFHWKDQYKIYSTINFSDYNFYINAYFSPSEYIRDIVQTLKDKYKIYTEQTIGVFYRGTDKYTEIESPDFIKYKDQITQIKNNNPQHRILVVTDSTPFKDFVLKEFPDALFLEENRTSSTLNGIHLENSPTTNFKDIQQLFASFLILARCDHHITCSSNGSLWMAFYRGNSKNIYQYLHGKFYSS